MNKEVLSEREIVNKARDFFLKKGFKVALEVPFFEQSIDLVYIDKSSNIVAVEFKLADWKRAVSQAKKHVYGASKVYICIPKPKNTLKNLEEYAKESNIGVFLFSLDENNNIEIATFISAKKSNKIWKPGRVWLRKAFKKREKAVL